MDNGFLKLSGPQLWGLELFESPLNKSHLGHFSQFNQFPSQKIKRSFFSRTEDYIQSNFLTSPLHWSTPQIFIGIQTSVRFRICIRHQNRLPESQDMYFQKIEFCMKKCKIKQFQIMEKSPTLLLLSQLASYWDPATPKRFYRFS